MSLHKQDSTFDKYMIEIKQRLLQMTEKRAFRFQATKRADAERYLQMRSAITGYSDEEVRSLARLLSTVLPEAFKSYLRFFGHKRGELFTGSEFSPHKIQEYKEWAIELLQESSVETSLLPEASIVFFFHQGYTFSFFIPDTDDNPHLWWYKESDEKPTESATTFIDMLFFELELMESNYKTQIKKGGYFVRVNGNRVQETYPATSDKIKPLHFPDDIID